MTSLLLCLCGLQVSFASVLHAQRMAIVAPERNELSEKFAERLAERLAGKIRVLDLGLAAAAFSGLDIETPFNMTGEDSRRSAGAIGCDFLVLVRAGELRRTSLSKGEYFEAFAVTYLVNGRTGHLADWNLASFESASTAKAEELLFASVQRISERIAERTRESFAKQMNEKPRPLIETVPSETSDSDGFRPPIPYKRIKPEYTQAAFLYGVKAVVDVEADIEADGRISSAEVVRWAGFGLDESVVETVRKMNWRPAERGGRPLAMRVLLRYNFTKVEKE